MRATIRRRSTIGVATLAVAALALSGCAPAAEDTALVGPIKALLRA